MEVVLTGKVGQIKWVYYVAADIHGYTVTRDKKTKQWSLSGVLGTSNPYNLAQRPLTFSLPKSDGQKWTWPITSLEIDNGVVRAQLGPPD